jgi:site-specific DNA recombinase
MQPDILQCKNAVLYLRVSSEEQVDNFSLTTQEEICRREALHRGYEIAQIFREEGKSAKNIIGRPTLLEMITYCRKNKKDISAVFVYRLDRLSRQTSDYLALRKKFYEMNITIVSASEPTGNTATDRFVETMFANFAQFDNDVRSERTKNGLRARYLSGLCTGKPPLGYILQDGYAVKDGESFDKMKKAWDLMATGTKSLSEMAKIMNEWGLRKIVSGKEYKLRAQTVDRLFRHKFYTGVLTSNKYTEEPKGQHIAMITEEQYFKVQAIIDGRNRCGMTIGKRLKDNPDFPLRRSIKCGKCGGALSGGWSKGRSKKYAYYVCKSRCGAPSIAVKKLNDSLIGFLKSISPTKRQLDIFLLVLRKDFNQKVSLLRAKREKARQQVIELKDLQQALVLKNLKGTYSDEMFREQNKVLEGKIKTAEKLLGEAIFDQYNIEEVDKFMREKFSNLGRTYEETQDPGVRRVLLGSICPTGLAWRYSGLSNQVFSAQYQSILAVRDSDFVLSTANGIRTRDFMNENHVS